MFFALALLACLPASLACDVCGCSITGQYIGMLPQFHGNFAGLRWSEQWSVSGHTRAALAAGADISKEHVQSLDLLTRLMVNPRVQILLALPYRVFNRTGENTHIHAQGLGDISMLAYYLPVQTAPSAQWRHTLMVGGGFKLPTGNSRLATSDGLLIPANLQPGSGSFDLLVAANYTIRRHQWGLNTDLTAKLNTANTNDYRFGNRISGALRVFHWLGKGRATLLPNAGVFSELSAEDRDGHNAPEATGGWYCSAATGLDLIAGRFNLGINYQTPVAQNLGHGKAKTRSRWTASVNYIF